LLLTSALIAVPLFGEALQEVETRRGVQYAIHDVVALAGDYYVPKGPGKFPVVVAMIEEPGSLARERYIVCGDLTSHRVELLFSRSIIGCQSLCSQVIPNPFRMLGQRYSS
jgi:hypothetical protein